MKNDYLDPTVIFPQGEGSGLDADTVDGVHYLDILRVLEDIQRRLEILEGRM